MLRQLIGLFLFFGAAAAHAKVAGVADVPYVLESDRTEIVVDSQGRSTMLRDSVIRIVNDQGREAQSVQTLSFNSRAQTLKILEAATLNGPPSKLIKTDVPKRDIEIKEIGEMAQAFDSIKQASLSYPKVQVGSRLHLRYEMKNIEVPVKGFWSSGFQVGGDTIESFQLKIRSKLPLYFKVRDPKDRFAHSLAKKAGWNELEIHSTSPLLTVLVQEENPFTRPEKVASIIVSSLPDWSSYANGMVGIHESILKKPLPASFLEIQKKADAKASALERIQLVAALIAQDFRYFGDWRRRHGGFVPRSLEEIGESHYGDCKDLAMAATAIYRALGYKANLAWVFRGEVAPPDQMYALPIDTSFNHAIARVEADGKIYWIDATNPVAYAKGVFADIADRPSYVLYSDGGKLERTPALKAEDSLFRSHLAYSLQDDESLTVEGDILLGGRAAIGLTTRAFYSPVEIVNYDIIRMLSNSGKVSDSVVGDFERGSRVVQDVSIPVKFKIAETGLRTSAGLGFPLFRDDSISRLMVETKDRVSDIYLEPPNVSRTTIDLLNVKRVGRSMLDCDLKSEYVDLQRTVTDIKNGVSITDSIAVKKNMIPNERLKDEEFIRFQNRARLCFNRAAVIVEKR